MNGVRKPRSVLLAAVAVGASIGSSRLCGAPVPSLSAFARIPLCGPVIVHADFRAQQRRGICVGPRSPGSDPFTMAAAKRKTAESALSPARNVKRGKHRSAKDDADDVDDADLIIIGEDEGTGAFPVTKSSGYSAATDPETARQQAAALGIPERHVKGALALLDEGSTVPFIARYRKEATGGMDETQLRSLVRALERRQKVGDRRAAIIESLSKAKQLTEAIQKALNAATSLSELEDIYLPLRPKRKTRASDARAKGLDDLALVLMGQLPEGFVAPPVGANPYQNGPSWLTADPLVTARRFIKSAANSGDGSHSERLAGLTPEDALAGARDIAAQIWAEEPEIRKRAREPGFLQRALHVKSKERKKGADLHGNYLTYHDYSRPLNIAPPHAILALARGDREKILSIKLLHGEHEKGVLLGIMRKKLHERTRFSLSAAWKEQVETALTDSINRLLLPSLEREWWKEALEAAEEASFKTFAVNLRARLLQPPVKNYAVLGIDPGIRTGCKAALISPTGAVEDTLTFFPKGGGMAKDAMHLSALLERKSGGTEILVALGNGKGSRDAEAFLRNDVAPLLPANLSLRMTIIDEGGASVYSASELAGKELPAMDVTLRGAVSIARRLQDPLGELVKIEPKALGVGLYQHDVNQKRLSAELANVVESAVNAVGVDVNTASPSLLQYVAGLNAKVAHELVAQRDRDGAFPSRKAISKVKGLGPKTLLQAAGFLRIYGSSEPLDATSIHPESYKAAKLALKSFALGQDSVGLDASQMAALRRKMVDAGVQVGDLTLADIVESLRTAGRDPRETLLGVPPPILDPLTASGGSKSSKETLKNGKEERRAEKRVSLDQLVDGMTMQGVVRNVVAFGSFIDIGVQQDALLHISKMPRGAPPLQVGQRLQVVVEKVERPQAGSSGKTRISLKCG